MSGKLEQMSGEQLAELMAAAGRSAGSTVLSILNDVIATDRDIEISNAWVQMKCQPAAKLIALRLKGWSL